MRINMKKGIQMLSLLLLLPLLLTVQSGCTEEIRRPDVTEPLMPDIGPEGTAGSIPLDQVVRTTVCSAATSVYRIPSIICTADGTLLVFGELRHNS